MPNGYSNDLRERALVYKDANHTQVETCEIFQISRSALTQWLKLRRETGTFELKARPIRQRNRKIGETALKTYLEEHPDAYLREIAEEFDVSMSAISQACRRYGITRKKRQHATVSEMKRNARRLNRS